jgi:hypothetical protein
MKFLKLKAAKFFHFFLLITLCIFCVKADDSADEALGNLKDVWDGASKFVTGMAQSFGYVPSDYVYSVRVWNDSPGDVGVAKQEVTKVMGASFSGKVVRSVVLKPYTNTGDWLHEKLYFVLWLLIDKGNTNYDEYKTKIEDYAYDGTLVFPGFGSAIGALIGSIMTTQALEKWELYSKTISQKDEDNVYYFRAYTDKGTIKGEYLGAKTTTNDFSGVFYNSSNTNVSIKFMKDSLTYQALLEPGTFSLLNSTTTNPTSIRPGANEQRAFTFYQDSKVLAAIPISSEGICNMTQDPTTNKLVAGAPMVCTYEVFQGKNGPAIGIQGLAIGHYNQPFDSNNPTKSVVRDINPMQCHFWYQSADQATKSQKEPSSSQAFFNLPEQVWIFYKTKDYQYQKKVSAGDLIDFTLLRPRLSEKNAWLYVAGLQTTDDKKALNFLNRLADGAIGEDLKEPVTAISQFNENINLETIQPNNHGVIDDTKGSGIKGYVLLADKVLPRGVGFGPFYYQIRPLVVQLGQLIDLFGSYLNAKLFAKVSDMNQEVSQKIEQWITMYPQNNQTVITQVTDYLQQKGVDQLITNTVSPTRSLNERGKNAVTTLVSGPVSIAHYPYQQQAGTNEYVYYLGAAPDGWPTK